MQAKELLDIIGEAEDEIILDAGIQPGKRQFVKHMKWFGAIAACLVLAIGVGSLMLNGFDKGFSMGSGGIGHEEGSVFMSYAGPVFPLTLKGENAAISAERTITMDFEQYKQNYGKILISDAYVLTNDEEQEQTIHILYPFASALRDLKETCPVLTVNGEQLSTELHAGSYSGRFQGAWDGGMEATENPGSLNLLGISSWEEYQELLSDGTYFERALGEYVDLSHIPVTVYTFTDAWGPEEDSDAGIPNPSIRVMFDIDYENTIVLSYGFNGGYEDREKGIKGKEFSIPQKEGRWSEIPRYIIVIGEDIKNLNCQGYVTGGWDNDRKIESGVTVTRSESDLEASLCQAVSYSYQEEIVVENYEELEPEYGFELYYGLLKEHLIAYGLLSKNPVDRYSSGSLEFLDVLNIDRVFWLEAEVTIPAESNSMVEAVFHKEPSFDYHCSASENKEISGYDLVTELGSNVKFTNQKACLEDYGQIKIVRQNFGFDLEHGVKEVELDLNKAHYYLEVTTAEENE